MMSKLMWQCVLILSVFSIQGTGQENYDLMNWKTQYTVRTHLLQKMHDQYDLRREAVNEALKSRESMLAYRDEAQQRYLDLLGQFPEKTPLNPRIVKSMDLEGYRIENVLFESFPKHHVTANLYLPDGEGPFPGVIIFCGHEMTSKATESYQKTAILFAKNGFAALVVDPISQGEMVQFTDENGKRILRGSTTEHTLLNAGANLVGSGVVSYELYDNIRSLDYLISRPEVDANRLGCLGNSGGGTQTSYFMAFDQRVKVAAPCSYIARRERNLELAGASDGCQHLPYEGRELLEIGDFLIMFAPKPILVLTGRYDFVDYVGAEQTADELQAVFDVLGESEKVKLFNVDDGHGISLPKREAAVHWFKRWLCDDPSEIIESGMEVQSEEDLNCTPEGQVNALFPDEWNIQAVNLSKGRDLARARKAFASQNDLYGYQQQIRELLAMDDQQKNVEEELIDSEEHTDFRLDKYILRTDGEIPLPCLVYTPGKMGDSKKLVLCVMEEGKKSLAINDSLIVSHMQRGDVLVLADLRGMGETAEDEDANDWKYYNREYNNAMISLHLGKSIVGQRVTDLLTLLQFLNNQDAAAGRSVHLVSSGAIGPVAIYAALFRPQVKSVRVINSIQSYLEILNHPMERDWYSYVIPDVLSYLDLPDLLGLREDLEIVYQGEKSKIADHTLSKSKKIE